MITQRAMNFAVVLMDLSLPVKDVEMTNALLEEAPVVGEVLDNLLVKAEEKEHVVKSLFPEAMWKFLKLLCNHEAMKIWADIFEAYESLLCEETNQVKAHLRYAMKLKDEEIQQIKDMICKKYNKAGVILTTEEDKSLIGGMVLTVGNTEYDKSVKGAISELQKTLVRR